MKKLILLFCIVPFLWGTVAAPAQSIQTRFESERDSRGGITWVLRGRTTLPDGTISSHILYEEEEIPYSRQGASIKNGEFVLRYGPLYKRLPAGQYIWRVAVGSLASPHEEKFYYGTPYQKRMEIQEEMEFYQKMLQEALSCLRFLQEQENTLQKKDRAEAKKGLVEMHRSFARISKEYEERAATMVFPRSFQNANDFKKVLQNLQRLLQMRTLRIFIRFSLPYGEEYRELYNNFPDETNQKRFIEKLEREIQKLQQSILSRLPLPQNIGEKEFKEDLLYFNNFYMQIRKLYEQNQSTFHPSRWQQATAPLLQELESFRVRIEHYGQSPLAGRYPSIVNQWESLRKNFLNLFAIYTLELYRNAKQVPPPEVTKVSGTKESLEERLVIEFENLNNIVNQERERAQKSKEQAYQELLANVQLLDGIHEFLQKALQIQEKEQWPQWESSWRLKQEDFSSRIEKWKQYFPSLVPLFNRVLIRMDTRSRYHYDMLQGKIPKEDLKWKAYFRQLDWQNKLLIREIKTKCEEVRSGLDN